MENKRKRKYNIYIIYYFCNVFISLLLVLLKIKQFINCSYFICLLPVITVNVFLGITMVIICYLYVKGEHNNGNKNEG